MAVWLYVVSPPVAASLVVVCSVIAQLPSLPWIWRSIEARRVLPFIVPTLLGIFWNRVARAPRCAAPENRDRPPVTGILVIHAVSRLASR